MPYHTIHYILYHIIQWYINQSHDIPSYTNLSHTIQSQSPMLYLPNYIIACMPCHMIPSKSFKVIQCNSRQCNAWQVKLMQYIKNFSQSNTDHDTNFCIINPQYNPIPNPTISSLTKQYPKYTIPNNSG